MTPAYRVIRKDASFTVSANGSPLLTPGRKPLSVPSQALADAIHAEWRESKGRFSASVMPLTSLAYTAIDRIEGQKDAIIEVLLAYVDTDTLSYRSGGSDKLAQSQNKQWNPILDWARKTLGATWNVTSGVMPLDQPEDLRGAVARRLSALDSMQLSACCLLASGFSSLALMLAVVEGHIDAEEGFRLSRLEEDSQAEAWGVDDEAAARAQRLKGEILAAARFLRLLETP